MYIFALMMEAVRTSETSVYFYDTTLCNIPEGHHFHILQFFWELLGQYINTCLVYYTLMFIWIMLKLTVRL
jgi:hypothetical protein